MKQIFKRDSVGKTRVWSQEIDGNRYRTIAGIQGGALVTSGWTTCTGKQGRSDAEQAAFEVEANYKHKLTREYHETPDTISGGAHFFKPMLAQEYNPAKFQKGFAQPKLDGARCIATAQGLFSRQGKPFVSVPHIAEALSGLFLEKPYLILDGELYGTTLSADFGQIMSLVRQQKPTAEDLKKSAELIQYHVYDLPSEAEHGFGERRLRLQLLLEEVGGSIVSVETHTIETPEQFNTCHSIFIEEGYEGTIFRLDAPYEQKRSKNLLKHKQFATAEFECVAIEEGNGNWAGLAKRVICRLPDGRTFGAGIKGNATRAAELLNEEHNVVTVRYFELTPDGVPRFPVVIDFHGVARDD